LFVNVTLVPAATVRSGPNFRLAISTVVAAPLAAALGWAWADALAAALAAALGEVPGDPLGCALPPEATADGLGCAASYWPLHTAYASVTARTPTTADPNRMILAINRLSSSYPSSPAEPTPTIPSRSARSRRLPTRSATVVPPIR